MTSYSILSKRNLKIASTQWLFGGSKFTSLQLYLNPEGAHRGLLIIHSINERSYFDVFTLLELAVPSNYYNSY
jgi:hypothetical protein